MPLFTDLRRSPDTAPSNGAPRFTSSPLDACHRPQAVRHRPTDPYRLGEAGKAAGGGALTRSLRGTAWGARVFLQAVVRIDRLKIFGPDPGFR